jgi:hypothetical protein
MMCSCGKGLEVRNDYGFSVEHLPVNKAIAKGHTAEIRLRLIREGRWDDAKYRMRYFQPDGRGRLTDDTGRVLTPNDLYAIGKEEFRLYYTSLSTDRQTIELYFSDNFGKTVKLLFTFNNQQTH